jgi:hypothetical protein
MRTAWQKRLRTAHQETTLRVISEAISRDTEEEFGETLALAVQNALDETLALAVQNALDAAGLAIVPKEPTPKMLARGNAALLGWVSPALHADDAYRAMLAAAQEGGQ